MSEEFEVKIGDSLCFSRKAIISGQYWDSGNPDCISWMGQPMLWVSRDNEKPLFVRAVSQMTNSLMKVVAVPIRNDQVQDLIDERFPLCEIYDGVVWEAVIDTQWRVVQIARHDEIPEYFALPDNLYLGYEPPEVLPEFIN